MNFMRHILVVFMFMSLDFLMIRCAECYVIIHKLMSYFFVITCAVTSI